MFKTRERGKNEIKWESEGGFAGACAGVVMSVFLGFGCSCCWDVCPGIWGEARGVPPVWRGRQGCSQQGGLPVGAGSDWALLFIGPKKKKKQNKKRKFSLKGLLPIFTNFR